MVGIERVVRAAVLAVGAVAAMWLLSACEVEPAHVFGVNTSADGVDAAPGDGRCATAEPGACTLRAAVMEANALGEHVQIVLPAGTVTLSLGPGEENAAASDDLDIRTSVTITGDPAAGSTIDAGGVGRVFDLFSGTMTLTDVTITGGSTSLSGAGVQLRRGSELVATDVTITGNASTNGTGGLKLVDGATAQLDRVTVAGNEGTTAGGIVNAGVLEATNTTVSGNTAADGAGGGVSTVAPGATGLRYTTVAGNDGSGLELAGGTVTLAGTLVADQVSGPDCAGDLPTSAGSNLDSDATCLAMPAPGDRPDVNADLAPLSGNGGKAPTHRPQPGSGALDAIASGTAGLCDGSVPTDARGRARPTFSACDIGAVESGDLVVDQGGDARDANPGDDVCEVTAGSGDCTLRAAIDEANATPGAQQVVLRTDVTLTLAGRDENGNATGDLDVKDALTIVGGGHTIDARAVDRVLHATAPLTIDHATVTGGWLPTGNGAGILATAGLTLAGSDVRGNEGLGSGGGIAHTGGALKVSDSTVAANNVREADLWSPGGAGGGILSSGGSATIVRSTIRDNGAHAPGSEGGGLHRSGSAATVAFSTLSGNVAGGVDNQQDNMVYGLGTGGGIFGPVVLESSTVSGNTSHGDGGGLAGGPTTIRTSTITGNRATGFTANINAGGYWPSGTGGAAIGSPTAIASTIVGNEAELQHHGLAGGTLLGSIHTDSCAPSTVSNG